MELEAPGDWQLWPATRLSEVATMHLDAPRHLWPLASRGCAAGGTFGRFRSHFGKMGPTTLRGKGGKPLGGGGGEAPRG